MTKSFADSVADSLPDGITLPEAFRKAFDWMEANGCVAASTTGRLGAAPLVPPNSGSSYWCGFHPCEDRDLMRYWTGNPDPAVAARIAVIMRTGGDGSHAAIWRDDAGRQRFVHLGSGAGSTMVCVLTDDPVDMLRLFAVGYRELCWPDQYDLTPDEVREEDGGDDKPPPLEPFRAFLTQTFATTIPTKASAIVGETADMDENSSDDPFWRWTKSVCR